MPIYRFLGKISPPILEPSPGNRMKFIALLALGNQTMSLISSFHYLPY